MTRIIFAIFAFIFCSLWAEVRVEKIAEIKSIKEYNQWVKKNKAKYPGLKPIYIQHELIKRGRSRTTVDYEPERAFDPPSTNPFINEYNVRYYDEDGNVVKEEIIKGYVAVKVSLNFDEVLINKRDHPWYPEKRINIVKDNRGNIKFTMDNIFSLRFTGSELYIEEADVEVGASSLRLFDKNGAVTGNLEGASLPFYNKIPMCNVDKKFYVEGYLKQPDLPPGLLFLYTPNGDVLWRKEFTWPEKVPWGLYPSISGDGQVIAIGHVNKIYVYNKDGELRREYKYKYPYPALTALSCDGRYVAVATREGGTKIFVYDNENGELIWDKKIELLSPDPGNIFPIAISANGKYVAMQVRPDKVYLFDFNGEIIKEWDLQGIVTHPMVHSDKRIEVYHGVSSILQFIGDILIIKYIKDDLDIKTDFGYIIERMVEK